MPLLPVITYADDIHLYRWTMPGDRSRGAARAAEREAETLLIHSVFGPAAALEHTPDGAPYVVGESGSTICPAGHISISHTRGIVCMAVGERKIIGVDVERVTERTIRVRHKFLSAEELTQIAEDDPIANTIAWTAKEAAYKAALTPGLSLSDGIRLLNPTTGEHAGYFECHGSKVPLTFITTITDNLVVTLALPSDHH